MLPTHPIPAILDATRALLQLRARVAWQAVTQKPAAQATTVIGLILILPAAFQMGMRAANALNRAESNALLTGALLLLFVLQVLLLLAGNGGAGGVAEPIPDTVTSVLPVASEARLAADAVCFLASLPTLFLFVAFAPVAVEVGASAVLPLLLLGAFGIAFALLVTRLGTLIGKLLGSRSALIGALLLGTGLLAAVPSSAVASVVHPPKPAVRLPWEAPPPPLRVPTLLSYTPPGLAATTIQPKAKPVARVTALLLLSVMVAAAGMGTIALDRYAERREPKSVCARSRTGDAPRPAGALQTELRLLLRNPAAHLPLRAPAALLLTMSFAWIAPDLGGDAVQNLADLIGIGTLLYALLWQIQFVCNRFGSDAGSAAMLFALPVARWQLLVAKNAALGLVVLGIDSAVVASFAAAANPHLIPMLLGVLPALLLLLTALGNSISLLSPFAIARRAERPGREPERSLLFVYALVIGGTALLFLPVREAILRWGVGGYFCGTLYAAILYAASVAIAAQLIDPTRERRLIAALDGAK